MLSNAFFVATEFALTRLRQFNKDEFEDDAGLRTAWEMTERLEIYLTGCQVGITFSSVLLGIVAEPAVTELFHPLVVYLGATPEVALGFSVVLSVFVINLMHTVWAEQTPTYLGIEEAKLVARYCAPPHYYWTQMAYPFIFVGDKITKATLGLFGITMRRSWTEEEEPTHVDVRSQLVDLLKSEGLPQDRRDEVVKAMEIDEIPVSDIMVPREEIVCLWDDKPLEENLGIIRHRMQSRYPLVGESLDDFKGLIYASEMLAHIEELQSGEKSLQELSRADMTVGHDLPVSRLIDRFQEEYQELALVTRMGKTIGLVTLTDALEVIVGSAEDPMDLELRIRELRE